MSMDSIEGRKEIQESIDYIKIASLSQQIAETANSCSEIAKKLQDQVLNTQDSKNLEAELGMLIKKGAELSEDRARLISLNIEK